MTKRPHTGAKKKTKDTHPLAVVLYKDDIALLCKSEGNSPYLYFVMSATGTSFKGTKKKISIKLASGGAERIDKCHDFKLACIDKLYHMTYVRKGLRGETLMVATSKDLFTWKVQGKGAPLHSAGTLVNNYTYGAHRALYYGKPSLHLALSEDLKKWHISKQVLLSPRGGFFDHAPLKVIAATVIDRGILVLYDTSYKEGNNFCVQVGGALFSAREPNVLLWRSEAPLWGECVLEHAEDLHSIGAVFMKHKIFLYWASPKKGIMVIAINEPFAVEVRRKIKAQLDKAPHNPIIVPNPHNEWENEATFNPAALYEDGKVHLLYRAIGRGGYSCLGYASSENGFDFGDRLEQPAYYPREDFEGVHTKPSQYTDLYKSGGGWGGCEDPKLTAIDDKVYLTYVAYDGYRPPRVALTSIARSDFLSKKWKWERPILISPPGVVDKSGCILPEKINDKYVIFHRIFPHILVDFVDDLEFGHNRWLKGEYKIAPRMSGWDSRKLSVGAPPMRTDKGWLVIYHAVDDRDDSQYKIGAMILDKDNPAKVLARTKRPILVPDRHYENDGKPGVAYPCGAAIIEGELFVYYGGGDKVVCVATAPLDEFLYHVSREVDLKLTMKKVSVS